MGGIITGHWETRVAQMDFESKLILRALESEDVDERLTSLEFLVDAKLISDSDVLDAIEGIIKKENVPRFLPVDVLSLDSQRDRIAEKFPTLVGKNIALIGFSVRHGDIIDAVTPIYSVVSPRLKLKGEYVGDRLAGDGGGETVLKQPGYVVTGFDVQYGEYYGDTAVVQLKVIWTRLTSNGLDTGSIIESEKLGSGDRAEISEPPELVRASADAFISDFEVEISHHSNGDTFLKAIRIKDTIIVQNDW